MKMRNKVTSFFLTVCMIIMMIPASCVFADDSEIHISTISDYIDLVKNCHLDSWSQGKTVILDNDLDLAALSSEGVIATFGGTFNGSGHKITGLKLASDSDVYALFGIVQKDGVIENLTVEDSVAPVEKRERAGGIAQTNYGTIKDCSFNGTVSADSYVGGIAGYNMRSGKIKNCTSEGSVTGDSFTGGIVGYNAGKVSGCVNTAWVNTEYSDTTVTIDDIENTVENVLRTGDINGTENVSARTDTGGIAGYSSGTIKSCTNRGRIGYEHVGYNVGGIAGRSTGYLNGGSNEGVVYGRKDVGGIVGQMEPEMKLIFSDEDISNIRDQLSDISSLVDDAVSDAGSFSSDTKDILNKLNSYLLDAQNRSEDIINSAQDKASNAADKLGSAGDAVKNALSQTGSSIRENINEALDYTDGIISEISKLTDAAKSVIDNAQLYGISDADKQALQGYLDDITGRVTNINSSVKDLKKIRKAIKKDPLTVVDYIDDVRSDLKTVRDSVKGTGDVLTSMLQVIDKVSGEFTRATTAQGSSAQQTAETDNASEEGGTGESTESTASVQPSDSNVNRILNDIKGSDFFSEIETLRQLIDNFPEISIDTDGLDDILDADLDLDLDDSDIRDSQSGLYADLNGINSEMGNISDDISSEAGKLTDKLKSINDKLDSLSSSITDMYEKAQSDAQDISDHIKDISEDDIDGSRKGRTTACTNSGAVRSDLNCGGIVGNIGVEYDLDPEQDIQRVGDTNLDYVFNAKSIVDRCVNHGEITTRNNCAAGIAGLMELGIVYKSENYGDINGGSDYTGGITGYSTGAAKQSYSKGQLSGKKYVGGIVGYGTSVKKCISMAEISSAQEYKGAVAGSVKDVDSSDISDNYYVSDDLYGIDSVSYKGIAEPVTYEDAMKIDGVPNAFRTIQLIFKADDEVVGVVDCSYGESLSTDRIPSIPGKEGYNSRWSRSDFSNVTENQTITAIYSRTVTLIGSDLTRDNGRNILLATGSFDTGDALQFTKDTAEGRESERWIVSVPDDGSKTHEFRYLAPDEESEFTTLYLVSDDGSRTKLDTSISGEYISFTTDQRSFRLAVEIYHSPLATILIIVGIVAAAAAAIFIIVKLLRKIKRHGKLNKH